jgi:hypothetical protein
MQWWSFLGGYEAQRSDSNRGAREAPSMCSQLGRDYSACVGDGLRRTKDK